MSGSDGAPYAGRKLARCQAQGSVGPCQLCGASIAPDAAFINISPTDRLDRDRPQTHRTVSDQPGVLDHARRQLADTDTALAKLDADGATAADTLKRRPELRARVADIDHDLTADRRVRTRIARLEQPDTITNTLGPRPAPGPIADHWDLAASHLQQHQSAFNIHHGLGPQPRYLEHSAYATNHAALDQLIEPIHPDPPTPTINPPTIELGL